MVEPLQHGGRALGLRERPLILDGEDPREFACEVPAVALQREMQRNIESFLDELLSWTTFDISWTQRYAVEAISRMLYTLERGEVISKQDALVWATEAMPAEWRSLINQVRHDRFVHGTTRRRLEQSSGRWRSWDTFSNVPARGNVPHAVVIRRVHKRTTVRWPPRNGVSRNGDPADGAKERYTASDSLSIGRVCNEGSDDDEHRPLSCDRSAGGCRSRRHRHAS